MDSDRTVEENMPGCALPPDMYPAPESPVASNDGESMDYGPAPAELLPTPGASSNDQPEASSGHPAVLPLENPEPPPEAESIVAEPPYKKPKEDHGKGKKEDDEEDYWSTFYTTCPTSLKTNNEVLLLCVQLNSEFQERS